MFSDRFPSIGFFFLLFFLVIVSLFSVFAFFAVSFYLGWGWILPLTAVLTTFSITVGIFLLQKRNEDSASLTQQKVVNYVADISTLIDSRFIDIVSTKLFDNRLCVFKSDLQEWKESLDSYDEVIALRAKKALEVLSLLESNSSLSLRLITQEAFDIDPDYYLILTSDPQRYPHLDTSKFLSINTLSSVFRPPLQIGEQVEIKVQRLGKDPGQGVGYLEDGSMVVINGGSDYLRQSVKAHVVNVKSNINGRLIFCNLVEHSGELAGSRNYHNQASSYFVS